MIRDEHLVAFLTTVATELQNGVRPHLTSGMALRSVDSINVMLGRLIAEIQSGGEVAKIYGERWNQLASQAPIDVTLPASDPAKKPLQRMAITVDSMQAALVDEATFKNFVAALARGEVQATTWLKECANTLFSMWRNLEGRHFRPPVTEVGKEDSPDDPELIRRRLGAYLARRYAGLGEDCVESLRLIPGGQAKRTVLFQLKPNDALPTRLVMRQDMENSLTGTVVTDEFDILQRVFALGVPMPEPIFLEADPAPLGGAFLVMREVENAQPAGTYFPEERAYLGHTMGPRFSYEVAGALAQLHSRTLVQGASGADSDNDLKVLDEIQREWRSHPTAALTLGVELGFAWMRANPLPAGRPQCLIHGDVGAHNMMSRDGHLAALLDWELAKPGDPAEDIAQAKMMLLPDTMPWEEFARAYVEQGGPPAAVDEHAVSFYAVRTYLKHSMLNMRLWDYYTAGKRTDAAAASVASHWVDRLMLYLSRALAAAVASTH